MPRYFFHVKDGEVSLDEIGFECRDREALEKAALEAAGDALRDLGPRFWKHRHWTMWVVNEDRASVFILEFTASGQTSELN